MLIEFRVKNFRSFWDEQVLSLVANSDMTLNKNYFAVNKLRLLKAAGIYGPNASGKSNLIKAMDTMRDIVLKSASTKPGSRMPIAPFLLDDESKKQPSFFEVTFYHESIRYQYGFTATKKRVHDEWLIAYPKRYAQLWYERSFDKKTKKTDWKFGSFLKGDKVKLADKTREDCLFLSVGAQWNNEKLTIVYNWFKDKLQVVPPKEYLRPVTAEMLANLEEHKEVKKELYNFVIALLKKADLRIDGVEVKKITADDIEFTEEISDEERKRILQYLKEKPPLKVEMLHKDLQTGKTAKLPLQEESDGTQRFFQLSGPWIETVALGFTVFIDELEVSLHPLLTRELIKFIQNPKINKSGAQLIFATHDTTLLDSELFRRDQIWFTEKDKNGATNLYSMSDYKERRPRKGEAMQKGYLSGRYGAIPILEAFSLK